MQVTQVKKRRRRKYAAPVGGLFLLLALIGIIAVVISSIYLTTKVLDNSSERELLEDTIRPVLMFDPVPFDSPDDIPTERLLLYSMWSTLLSGKYDFEATGETLIPASDLDVAANRLFASETPIVLDHQNFNSGDYLSTFYYDEETASYVVPLNADLYVYSPLVETIEKIGDYYRLYVGYIPPGSAWTTLLTGGGTTQPDPDKYMYYYMVKNKDSYQIAKVEDPPANILTPVEDFEGSAGQQTSGPSTSREEPARVAAQKQAAQSGEESTQSSPTASSDSEQGGRSSDEETERGEENSSADNQASSDEDEDSSGSEADDEENDESSDEE